MIVGSNFDTGGEGEGSKGGGDEPTKSKLELSDFEEEEENEEEEDMADQTLEWMSREPLALSGDFHKMPKRSERIITKYDPDRAMREEDHLEKFYLQL